MFDSFINLFVDLFSCNFDVDLCGMTPETYIRQGTGALEPSWARATGYTPTGQLTEQGTQTGPTGPQGNFVFGLVCKQYETLCLIWSHLQNLKNVRNTNGGLLLLVKLQTKPPWVFFTVLKLCK